VHGEHRQISLTGVHLDQALLLRVVNVFGDTWQAQLAIDHVSLLRVVNVFGDTWQAQLAIDQVSKWSMSSATPGKLNWRSTRCCYSVVNIFGDT
jgi:hypothetical protein